MAVLWINLSLVYFITTLSRYFSKPKFNSLDVVKPNWLLTFFAILIVILVSGLRNNIGDTTAYMYSYANFPLTWENVLEGKDAGFNILQMLLQKISNDPQLLIFTVSFITNLLIFFVIYNYARLFELAVYVYLTGGLFVTGMNGIRQFLAAAIVFSATKYLFEGNWKKYFLIVLLAAQIHNSAYILLPIYFMVRQKAWSKSTFLLLILAVGAVMGFKEFSSVLFSALEDTQYGGYQNSNEGGANYLRVCIYAAPLILAFAGREKFAKICPTNNYIVNMSILGFIFMLISTQDWIFARFAYYFGLYNILLLSWLPKLFRDKDQKLIYFCILIFYLVFFYLENVVSMGLSYKSNYLTW